MLIRLTFLAIVVVELSGFSLNERAVAATTRPNVVLIVADDLGYPDLGCIGSKPILTPNLDRMAAAGVRATSFYVTWPACTPSRGSILTGRYPQRNGLYDMIRNDLVNYEHQFSPEEYAVSPEMTLGLDVREVTIGDVLQRAGYRTGMIGKWDMGQAKRFLPLQRGFDFFYGHGNNGIDYYTHERYGIPSLFRGNQRTQADRGMYATDIFSREAKAFVEHDDERPWFLYLAFNAPHGASSFGKPGVQSPEKYKQMYAESLKEPRLRGYYGAVTCMDQAIGELMQAVADRGQADQTMWMFMSDNGGSGNGGNSPLRGAKSTMWEGGLRVPFVMHWPGTIEGGRISDQFLTSLELFPTLIHACQAADSVPQGISLDGFDMVPVLRGEVPSPRTEMFWQRRGDRAARVDHWKWVDSAKGRGLFDLATDLGETNDLSAQRPEVLARLKASFEQWQQTMDNAEPRGPFRDY
ncbi:MAG: sulfatase-like hydrolase/transferase [Planctomycetaceae bacterium]